MGLAGTLFRRNIVFDGEVWFFPNHRLTHNRDTGYPVHNDTMTGHFQGRYFFLERFEGAISTTIKSRAMRTGSVPGCNPAGNEIL